MVPPQALSQTLPSPHCQAGTVLMHKFTIKYGSLQIAHHVPLFSDLGELHFKWSISVLIQYNEAQM
jgi:hypothetical protein